MGGEDDGVALLVQFFDEYPQRLAQFHVHACGGFIQNDDRWAVYQGLCHHQAALHAARQIASVGARFVFQIELEQQFVYPSLVFAYAKIARLELQGLTHVEKRVVHQFLRHHTQAHAALVGVFARVVAHDADVALAQARQARHGRNQRGFARAIGAEQSKKLTLFHIEAHAFEGGKAVAVGFVCIIND